MKTTTWHGEAPAAPPVLARAAFTLSDVHCWVCAETLERSLNGITGVASVTVHPVTGRTSIAYDPELLKEADLLEAIRHGGFDAHVLEPGEPGGVPDPTA